MKNPPQPATSTMKESLSPSAVQEIISQLEIEHDLLQYTVDGWCVWPMLRSVVAALLVTYTTDTRNHLRWFERAAIAVQDIPELLTVHKARYVVKTYSSARAEQEGYLYKDLYFDDLLKDVGDYFKIESINNKTFLTRSRASLIPSDLTACSFELISNALFRTNYPGDILEIANRISATLQRVPGLEALTTQRVTGTLLYFYWSKRLYAWLLRRIQPEYLLVADPSEYNIVAAAKERGIKVVEFQHGLVYRHHPAYAWSTYALDYKASMPIPERIFLYGKYWQEELAATGFWREELCPVGSLRLDQYRKLRATKKDEVCIIVLTAQGTDTAQLIAFISDFLKKAEGRLAFHLTIKLHPVYDTCKEKELYEAAFAANKHVCVLLGSEPPSTFELLAQAHVHVSISSTCHYEALGLGVPTVILPLTGHQVVSHLHTEGHAFLAQTASDLLDILVQPQNYQVPQELSERYFTANALENIERELGV